MSEDIEEDVTISEDIGDAIIARAFLSQSGLVLPRTTALVTDTSEQAIVVRPIIEVLGGMAISDEMAVIFITTVIEYTWTAIEYYRAQ